MLSNQGAVYDPEDLSLLGQVMDRAVQALPAKERTAKNRARIAQNILACAASGERDPVRLERAALTNLSVTIAA